MCEIFTALTAGAAASSAGAATAGAALGYSAAAAPIAAASAFTLPSLSTLSLIGGAVSTGLQFAGNMQQVKAQNAMYEYNAAVARNNAKLAEYEGQYAKTAAEEKARIHGKQVQGVLGQQRAAMGASGLVADSGTFLDLGLDTIEQGKLDELAILHEGDKEAWRAKVQGQNYTSQANMLSASKTNPFMAAAPSLLSGLSNTGLNYYKLRR